MAIESRHFLLTASTLQACETALARHKPFGDPDYLASVVSAHYEQRIAMLAAHEPAAQSLSERYPKASTDHREALLSDPLVRYAINALVCHYALGTPAPEPWTKEVLLRGARQLQEGVHLPLLCWQMDAILPVQLEHHQLWIWRPSATHDGLNGEFERFVQNHAHIDAAAVDFQAIRAVSQALRLLRLLLPKLASSALRHVRFVVFAERPEGFTSASAPLIQSTVFLHRRFLDAPALLAENLLHEAMHQKFLDLAQTHSMLREGYDPRPCVSALWNSGKSGFQAWDWDRTLTVLHVYTALAVFYAAAHLRGPLIKDDMGHLAGDAVVGFRRSLDRARFLHRALDPDSSELGPAGRVFIQWLGSLIARMDRGSTRHLDDSPYIKPQPPSREATLVLEAFVPVTAPPQTAPTDRS